MSRLRGRFNIVTMKVKVFSGRASSFLFKLLHRSLILEIHKVHSKVLVKLAGFICGSCLGGWPEGESEKITFSITFKLRFQRTALGVAVSVTAGMIPVDLWRLKSGCP